MDADTPPMRGAPAMRSSLSAPKMAGFVGIAREVSVRRNNGPTQTRPRPARHSNSLLFKNAVESDARMAAGLGKAPDFSRLFGGAVDEIPFRTGNLGRQYREFGHA